jgi:peptidoglycan endopeptidase LytE
VLTLPSTEPGRPTRRTPEAATPTPVLRPRGAAIRIRRRRSLLTLGTAFAALLGAGALSGAAVAWAAAAVMGVLSALYLVLLARVRRLATEREMASAFCRDDAEIDWAALEREVAADGARAGGTADEPAPVAIVDPSALHLGRFVASYLLGWILSPVVAAVRLAGGDLSDLERHRVLERLVRAQQLGRSQSLRILAAGVVATAGVGALGGLSAGVASASPAVTAAVPGAAYTVRAGDTLSSIAARYGTTVTAIATANQLSDPNLIFPGQRLTIPGGGATGAATASGTYRVQPGDTLSSLAARFGTTVAELAALNHLSDPNLIYAGQTLVLDGSAPATTSAATTPPASPPSSYTVHAGDTLGSIAARFGTTVAELAALNNLSDPNLIYVGEVLQVAGRADSTGSSGPSGSPGGSAGSGSEQASGESSAAATAVKVALEQVGKPYVWGGAGPDSFDCSGLVMYAWAAAGVALPHYTVSQYDDTERIDESQLEPGDLVFYNNESGPQPGHVAMYIGNGQVVSANEPGTNVQTQPLGYDGVIFGFGRVR